MTYSNPKVPHISAIDPTYLSLTIPAKNIEKKRSTVGRWWWWEGGATKFNVSSRQGFKFFCLLGAF